MVPNFIHSEQRWGNNLIGKNAPNVAVGIKPAREKCCNSLLYGALIFDVQESFYVAKHTPLALWSDIVLRGLTHMIPICMWNPDHLEKYYY